MSRVKNIAVILAGIEEEYQNAITSGIIKCAKEKGVNLSFFVAFGGVISDKGYDRGEYNIYSLVNYDEFDGVILMINTISDKNEKAKILERVKASKLPVAVLDYEEDKDFYNVSIDNNEAMCDLVKHVIDEHGARVINYISGPVSNPEAMERYEAFRTVMAEKGIELDKRRVYFGEFRKMDGRKAVNRMFSQKLSMPDAFICANDTMALGVLGTLEKMGYKVPDDVIVTGFDNTYYARHHYPSVTTVDKPLHESGQLVCEIICDVLDGKEREKHITVPAQLTIAESCGCKCSGEEDIIKYKRNVFISLDDCSSNIYFLNRMNAELAESNDLGECMDTLAGYVGELGCDRFSICLRTDWESLGTQDDVPVSGYSEKMICPLLWNKGKVSRVAGFKTTKMFPKPISGSGNVNFFLPLHFRDRCLGYMCLTNSDFPLESMLCHSLEMNISNSIENVRKTMNLNNIIGELDKLYAIDPLCGIYNRNGFIREADKIYELCRLNHKKVLIAFIDMDGLKQINDNFGHNEGDFALMHLAKLIEDCCDEKMVCARFGGDEFIIMGESVTGEEGDELEADFQRRISHLNISVAKPYKIDASMGTVITDIGKDSLFNIITLADEAMYEAKQRKRKSKYLRS